MKSLVSHLLLRPRLYMAAALGVAVALLVPDVARSVTRALLGWNVGVWSYLLLMGKLMIQADHNRLKRLALAQAQGAAVVLGIVICAVVASIGAVIFELSVLKGSSVLHGLPQVLFTLSTVTSAWLLLPVVFTFNYASTFYRNGEHPIGLQFPDDGPHFRPDYADFLYFSFTIAATSQTSDVAVNSRPMRKLVLLQSLLSFAFNTVILALTINIAAGLF